MDAVLDALPQREKGTIPPRNTPREGDMTGPETVGTDVCREAALSALAAHTVSKTRGRVRVRHPALRRPEAHAPLREALDRQRCFTALTFSARTGSLLLEYDGHRLSHADFCEAALPLGRFLAQYDQARTI